jgi:hypothetical protein
MIAISRDDHSEVVLSEDKRRPKEKQTIFFVRPLGERTQRQLFNLLGEKFGLALLMGSGDISTLTGGVPLGDIFTLAIPDGLTGWRNFRNPKGRLIYFKKGEDDGMDPEQLGLFGWNAKVELFFAILGTMQITEGESKN